MLQGRTNVVPSRAAVCTVIGTKTRLGTALFAANRHYLESTPLALATTIAGMWFQGTIPRYGVDQMLIRCEMHALLLALLVIVIATAVGGPQFSSYTVIT
jgi:hypothetical protein